MTAEPLRCGSVGRSVAFPAGGGPGRTVGTWRSGSSASSRWLQSGREGARSAAPSSEPCWPCWLCIAGSRSAADRLIDALWEDGQSANPANALQAQIGQLRRTLGPAAILTSEAGYALAVGPDDMDAVRFEQLVAKGRRLLRGGRAWSWRRPCWTKRSSCAGRAAGRVRLRRLRRCRAGTSGRVDPRGPRGQGRGGPGSRPPQGGHRPSWRPSVANIRSASVCGSCSSSPCTGTDGRPTLCGPTPRSVTVWSRSSGSTLAWPYGSSSPASWPRTRRSPWTLRSSPGRMPSADRSREPARAAQQFRRPPRRGRSSSARRFALADS